MNNKYQDALEKMFYYNMMPNDITEEELKQCDKTLQELVDIYPEYLELKARATPMKPGMILMVNLDSTTCIDYYCPHCKKERFISRIDGEWVAGQHYNRCPNCGQAIDWSRD